MDTNERLGAAIGAYILMCDEFAHSVGTFLELMRRGEVGPDHISAMAEAALTVRDKTHKLAYILNTLLTQ